MVNPDAVLQVSGVTKSFGDLTVLRNVTLDVRPGEGLALQGGNGTGKTTLLRIVLGLLRPDAGTVRLCGVDPVQRPVEARREVGYVPQKPSFAPGLTVKEALDFFVRCRGGRPDDVEAAVATTGIGHWMQRRVETLSGGMNQRLAIAVALVGRPKLLVLDEPGANLDRHSLEDLLEGLRAFRDDGTAVLLATHDAREVEAVAHRVMILDVNGGDRHEMVVGEARRRLGAAVCPA